MTLNGCLNSLGNWRPYINDIMERFLNKIGES